VHNASEPNHEDREQGHLDDEPEAFDEEEAPVLGVVPKGDERFTLTLETCGQLASTANSQRPAVKTIGIAQVMAMSV
jgi:hypothetical protein